MSSAFTHCINPDCPHPYPQTWGNKFCQSCGTPLQLQNRYVPLKRLGAGGFAVIYTVYDLATRTEQVLKVLVETSPKALELFALEANVLASLRHPGVPKVEPNSYFQVKLGNSDERSLPCLVMEKINGQTLQDILDQHPQGCPEAWVLNWLCQAVDILGELHRRQIIHRDLKPENLMLRQDSQQLVAIDFGGAKQIGPFQSQAQASSTRLVSAGYSPPEQISGGAIRPASDFYALGRTLIHLLTGQYPADLEDPITGELRWRQRTQVNPQLADLLDAMTRLDVNQRPASAAEIQSRLNQIAPAMVTPGGTARVTNLGNISETLVAVLTGTGQGVEQIILAVYRTIVQVLRACLDTFWGMLLGWVGGSLGAGVGFLLAYRTPVGALLTDLLARQWNLLVPDTAIAIGPEVILFGLAGLGTALGLTEAGGFGQRKRFWIAGFMGIVSYWCGWLSLQVLVPESAAGLASFSAIAIFLLTLALALPSHHLVHALIASLGTAAFIASLAALRIGFTTHLWQLLTVSATPSAFFVSSPGWLEFWSCVAFFGLLGSALGFCLGISSYLVVPLLRFLGWR